MLMGMVSRPGSSRRGWGVGAGDNGRGEARAGKERWTLSSAAPRDPYLAPLSEDSHPAPFQAPASGDK